MSLSESRKKLAEEYVEKLGINRESAVEKGTTLNTLLDQTWQKLCDLTEGMNGGMLGEIVAQAPHKDEGTYVMTFMHQHHKMAILLSSGTSGRVLIQVLAMLTIVSAIWDLWSEKT